MKSFQIKDLTVILSPQNVEGIKPDPFCGFVCSVHPSVCAYNNSIVNCLHTCFHPTYNACVIWACTYILSDIKNCRAACSLIDSYALPLNTTIYEAELPNLKKSELEELRAGIAELQNKVEAQLKQAPEDLDLLEGKMKEALEEIARRKAGAKKG